MDNEKRLDYLRRLFTPYKKGNKIQCFLMQYLQGGGNELKEKFWSSKSSSRLCFDLYSWMGADSDYLTIEFEKKLPGIISGGRQIYPNMDVVFERKDGVFFIESKYTETVFIQNFKDDLAEAYWNTGDNYKSSTGKIVNFPIIKRYHNYEFVKNAFLSFIDDMNRMSLKEDGRCWFDAKQETCHLLGIVLYALDEKPNKPIHFLNVAANYSTEPSFAEDFRPRAEEMVQSIFGEYNLITSFDYQLCSVMDYFGSMMWLDKKGYACDRTIRDILLDYSEPIH